MPNPDAQQVIKDSKELIKKSLEEIGKISVDARDSVSFIFKTAEEIYSFSYTSPEKPDARAKALKIVNELITLYEKRNDAFLNKLVNRGGLADFFDKLIGSITYFSRQNSINQTLYPTNFRELMKERNVRNGWE